MASPKKRPGGSDTSVQATAAVLREEILSTLEDGRFIGAEDDLIARLGVSRPTIRQAARILEQEQLLSVRRGPNGGFFSAIPTIAAVAHTASIFLRSRATTVDQLYVAAALIAPEVARLAAANPSAEVRTAFADYVDENLRTAEEGTGFIRVVRDFGTRLAELAANRPLGLFFTVLMELATAPVESEPVFADAHRRAQTTTYHRRMAAAVRKGEQSAAIRETSRYYALVRGWSGLAYGESSIYTIGTLPPAEPAATGT